jgi:hypothetical protein
MAPRIVEMAMRSAIEQRGVAVVVIPGEVFLSQLSNPDWKIGPAVDFAAVARAVGLFAHDGPAIIDVVTARQELTIPGCGLAVACRIGVANCGAAPASTARRRPDR